MNKEVTKQLGRWVAKKKSVAACREEVAKVLQALRRVQEADFEGFCLCVTCGKKARWNDGIQGGHFIKRKHASTAIIGLNIWPQCIRCNHFLDGNESAYRKFLGERLVNRLEALKRRPVQFTRLQLAIRIVRFRTLLKLEKERIE